MRLVLTGLDGPTEDPTGTRQRYPDGSLISRADIGLRVRAQLRAEGFPLVGAFLGGLPMHGPMRGARTMHVDRARALADAGAPVLVVERWRGDRQHVAATVYATGI